MVIQGISGGGAYHPIGSSHVPPEVKKGAGESPTLKDVLLWLQEASEAPNKATYNDLCAYVYIALTNAGKTLIKEYPHLTLITEALCHAAMRLGAQSFPCASTAIKALSDLWTTVTTKNIPIGPQRDGLILDTVMCNFGSIAGAASMTSAGDASICDAWENAMSIAFVSISNDSINWSGKGANPYTPLVSQMTKMVQWPGLSLDNIIYGGTIGVPTQKWLADYNQMIQKVFPGGTT